MLQVSREMQSQGPSGVGQPGNHAPEISLVGIGLDLPLQRREIALHNRRHGSSQQDRRITHKVSFVQIYSLQLPFGCALTQPTKHGLQQLDSDEQSYGDQSQNGRSQ